MLMRIFYVIFDVYKHGIGMIKGEGLDWRPFNFNFSLNQISFNQV